MLAASLQATHILSHPTMHSFADAGLPDPIQRAVTDAGYETPTPIQAEAIGPLLEGRDVIGEAKTGTGKTAAFALPLLARLDAGAREPQILVLAPTRELAMQVAEAFEGYARYLQRFSVACVYGGQPYGPQLRQLERGPQVVVGTPGRLLDHLRRGTLKLGTVNAVVLDEADEMLRMGFIEDVQAVLDATREDKQVALFSATMPASIRDSANAHTHNAATIRIESETTTADNIKQTYWFARGINRLEALERFIEVNRDQGALIFTRTKAKTEEVAAHLERRGYSAAALNGDMNQATREAVVARLRDGRLDIVVATDVAARGLDVQRISLVINFEMPFDVESYVHRIGRTGRAGRAGKAIAFASGRDKGLMRVIERTTGQKIQEVELPSRKDIAQSRELNLRKAVEGVASERDLSLHRAFVESLAGESPERLVEIAASLAALAEGDRPLINVRDEPAKEVKQAKTERQEQAPDGKRDSFERKPKARRRPSEGDVDMVQYRIEVGSEHGVKPKNIVGAIANEAGLDSQFIGAVEISDQHSIVDLPDGMPKEIFRHLRKVRVCGRQLLISHVDIDRDTVVDVGARSRRPKASQGAKKKRSNKKSQQRSKREPTKRAA